MSTHLHHYIPPSPDGGTRFGGHFLALFHECPYKWALRFIAPHPDGTGQGLETTKIPPPLGVGTMFHTYLEAWYASRIKDGKDTGEPDHDRAMAVMLDAMAKAERDWEGEDQTQWLKDRDLVTEMANRYNAQYGPGGLVPEYRNLQVLCDPETGEPWIEREVEVPLGDGYIYTCRIDLVAHYYGTLCVIEHKTCSASGFWGKIASMDVEIQPAGELLALQHSWPYETLGMPSAVVLNLVNKNPPKREGGKTLPFFRDEKTRTQAEVDHFRWMARRTLDEIEARLAAYHKAIETQDTWDALRDVFTRRGQFIGGCYKWNRPCQYIDICQATQHEHRAVAGFRPRTTHTDAIAKDDDE